MSNDLPPVQVAPATYFYRLPTSPAYTAVEREGPPLLPSGDSDLRGWAPFLLRVDPPPALVPIDKKAVPSNYAGAASNITPAAKGAQTSSAGLRAGEAFTGSAVAGGRELNPTAPQIGDRQVARSVREQVSVVASTPPLVLYINPTSFQVTRTKVQQLQDRSRYGYVYQPWGEEAENLSISIQCGAFVSPGRGIQRASRADSAAWQQLEALLALYQSGGSVYDPYGEVVTPLAVGRTTVRYDGWTYSGHLEQLSWAEDEHTQLGGVRVDVQMVADLVLDEEAATSAPLPVTRLPTSAGVAPPAEPNPAQDQPRGPLHPRPFIRG